MMHKRRDTRYGQSLGFACRGRPLNWRLYQYSCIKPTIARSLKTSLMIRLVAEPVTGGPTLPTVSDLVLHME